MFNEEKIEYVRKLIQESLILGDHEKSDWLNLLELMNDKQLGELEEILKVKAPAPAQPVTPPVRPPQPAPSGMPLSHISNLPTGDGFKSVSQPKPQAPVNITPPKPAVPKAPMHQFAPVAPKPKPLMAAAPIAPRPTPPPTPMRSTSPAPVAPSKSTFSKPVTSLQAVEDLAALSINDIRAQQQQTLLLSISALVNQFGYFTARQHLEMSPLYKAYLETGKQRLSDSNLGVPSALTHEEFELVSDILQSIRVNRS